MFQIIEKLGGWKSVKAILARRGIELSDFAYAQWRSRKALPQYVSLALELEATQTGVKYRPIDLQFKEAAA